MSTVCSGILVFTGKITLSPKALPNTQMLTSPVWRKTVRKNKTKQNSQTRKKKTNSDFWVFRENKMSQPA